MGATTGLDQARAPYSHPAAELSLPARIAAASALVLGSGCQIVAFLLIPHNEDTTAWLTWIAENESRGQLPKMFDVLAMPFLIASAAIYIMLGRRRSPRLAWIGGIAMAAGLVGLAMLQGWEVLAYNLVTDGAASPETVATAVDDITSSPAGITVFVLFLMVGFIGYLLTMLALWRSRVVPRLAVLLLLTGFIVDAFVAPVAGQIVSFVGAAWVAVIVIRARGG